MAVFDFGAPMAAYDALAKEVDPASVLVYYPDWRRDPYDINYPDYTMSGRAAGRIRQLKALGYRVMLHVNIFGVGYGNPLYKRFAPLQLKNRQTGELQAWTLSEDPIGYMNTASEEWQSFFTDTLKKIYADYAPDEVPKLEGAFLRTRDKVLVVCVAADPDKAAKLLGPYFPA